jgi:hypothetical protein
VPRAPAPERVKVLFKRGMENKRIHHKHAKNRKPTQTEGRRPSAASLFFVFFLPLW